MEILNRGLITDKQAACIFNLWHARSVSEIESALNATSDQWEVMYKAKSINVMNLTSQVARPPRAPLGYDH